MTWLNAEPPLLDLYILYSMVILFVETITLSSLFRLIPLGRSLGAILYFDRSSPLACRVLSLLRRLGVVHCSISRIDNYIGQVRNASGDSEFGNTLSRAREICRRIRKERLEADPLIEAMRSFWTKEKLLLYFDKLVEREVNAECFRLSLVKWIMQRQFGTPGNRAVLLLQQKHWFSAIREEARRLGIELDTCWSTSFLEDVVRRAGRIAAASLMAIAALVEKMKRARAVSAVKQHSPAATLGGTLAVRYWYRTVRLDPGERSEFFWLNELPWSDSRILLYDYVSGKHMAAEELRKLESHGIQILGRAPGIQSWCPSVRVVSSAASAAWALLKGLANCLVRGKSVPAYTVWKLVLLAVEFAYWHDFFQANDVKAHLGTLNTTVGQVLAMDRLEGITMAYQYSASNLFFPTKLLTAGENVQFVFSSAFERLFQDIEAPVEYIVKTGYVYDSVVHKLNPDRAAGVRVKLQANGAQYVICFFDENTIDKWDILCSSQDAVRDYQYLLTWLLSDPTLGMIFKPKNSLNLFDRLAPISGLIEQARQTGRCVFLMSDMLYGNIFPAEAALAADVCIGKLVGTSAPLEARLVGKPTLLVDSEGLKGHPFYYWGKGRILFEDWSSLRLAVEQYHEHPSSNPVLGEWSPELEELDRFQDGCAGLRLGSYIFWIHDGLKRGFSKQDAMAEAAEKYTRRWGEGHVTRRNLQGDPSSAS